MEETLEIIGIVSVCVVIVYLAILIWHWKSKERLSRRLLKVLLETILFALEIPQLVLQVSLGKSYGITIFLLCMWGICIVLNAFIIGMEIGDKNDLLEAKQKEDDNS